MKSEACDIEVTLQFFPPGPLHPPVPSHIPNFIQILPSRLSFALVDHPVKIKKWPFTLPKTQYKHHKMFILNQNIKYKKTHHN